MTEEKKAIKYLENNNGVAGIEKFLEDFDPIGEKLIDRLIKKGEIETATSLRNSTTIVLLLDREGAP